MARKVQRTAEFIALAVVYGWDAAGVKDLENSRLRSLHAEFREFPGRSFSRLFSLHVILGPSGGIWSATFRIYACYLGGDRVEKNLKWHQVETRLEVYGGKAHHRTPSENGT